jgi:hypothetical protein
MPGGAAAACSPHEPGERGERQQPRGDQQGTAQVADELLCWIGGCRGRGQRFRGQRRGSLGGRDFRQSG